MEDWKKMVDYEDEYEISSRGKICSIEREISIVKNFGKTVIKKLSESKMISVAKTTQGNKATLFKNGERKVINVARMMMLTFEPTTDYKNLVLFHDNDKNNVSMENCYWASQSDANESSRFFNKSKKKFYSYPFIYISTRRFKDGSISQTYYKTYCKCTRTGKVHFVGTYKDEDEALVAQDRFLYKLEQYTPDERQPRLIDEKVKLTSGFKWIPGFEGLYEVHPELGIFKCKSFKINKVGKKVYSERKNVFEFARYCKLIALDGNIIRRSKKSIMAELFVENPNGYEFVLHNNKDAYDCSPSNLRWVSSDEYYFEVGKPNKSTRHPGIVYDINCRHYRVTHNKKFMGHFWTLEEAIQYKQKL